MTNDKIQQYNLSSVTQPRNFSHFFQQLLFSVVKATLESQMSVRLSVTKTPQHLRIAPIDHRAYRPSSLLTIELIDHQVYRPSSLSTIKPIEH